MERKKDIATSPGKLAWRKFKRDPLAMTGMCIILCTVLVAILGANIRPDQSPWASHQMLGLKEQAPGFNILVAQQITNDETCGFFDNLFFGGCEAPSVSFPVYSKSDSAGMILLEEFNGHNELRPGIQRIIPWEGYTFYERRFALGTDGFGRDVLSRLMAGTIVSLSVGLIAVVISLVIGIVLGSLAGFFRSEPPRLTLLGRTLTIPVDDLVMWFVNVVWSIPTLLLVIAITLALGKGFIQVFVAIGLTMWVEVARVVRGEVISIREKEYVEAAKALGFSKSRIIIKHILPNALSPVIVIAAANFATAILMEAGLSFLGIGAQLPMVSWGSLIRDHYHYMSTDLYHLALMPGLCIMLLVLAFTWIGNGLRDALDARAI